MRCTPKQPSAGAHRYLRTFQFVVAKSVRGDATFTDVVPVDGDARLDEVARMLSGSVTDKSRQAAGELLEGGAPVRDGKSTRSRR